MSVSSDNVSVVWDEAASSFVPTKESGPLAFNSVFRPVVPSLDLPLKGLSEDMFEVVD